MKCHLPKKLIRDQVPKFLFMCFKHTAAWLLPNLRLPERKRMFRTNHIVQTDLGTVSHSYQGKFYISTRNCVSFKCPDNSLRPALKMRLPKMKFQLILEG